MAQSGLLEDYTERRVGASAAAAAAAPTASSVAATLETMIQLQQRLLSLTAAQQQQAASMGLPAVGGVGGGPLAQQPTGVGSSGYQGTNDFGTSARGLPDVDLQKSLQQLRQSQRYNVGGATSYAGAGASVGLSHQQGGYLGGSAGSLRDSGSASCYQSSTVDTYSAKKAPFATAPIVPGSYSAAGSSQVTGSFGSTGSYGTSGTLGSGGSLGGSAGLARTNEYRKSSLGPTAPIPTTFGRASTLSGQMRPAGILKRY